MTEKNILVYKLFFLLNISDIFKILFQTGDINIFVLCGVLVDMFN